MLHDNLWANGHYAQQHSWKYEQVNDPKGKREVLKIPSLKFKPINLKRHRLCSKPTGTTTTVTWAKEPSKLGSTVVKDTSLSKSSNSDLTKNARIENEDLCAELEELNLENQNLKASNRSSKWKSNSIRTSISKSSESRNATSSNSRVGVKSNELSKNPSFKPNQKFSKRKITISNQKEFWSRLSKPRAEVKEKDQELQKKVKFEHLTASEFHTQK